jgi:predicted TIM-barrel fold metal-dependent hydrolase
VTTTVDVHCHTFNADDLPVEGFVRRVSFHDDALADDIATVVDALIQGRAPGYLREKQRLDALLASPVAGAPAALAVPPDLEAETDAALAALLSSDPALVVRLGARMPKSPAETAAAGLGTEGVGDWLAGARRAVRWVELFGMSRLDVTSHLVTAFGEDQVDLFTPMLVDLGMGLHDTAGTSMPQQVELQEKISRLSMLGRLPGTTRSRVHPFIGFDPRRELQGGHDVVQPLELVRTAVEKDGFIGVKLYPPMGFRPIDNTKTRDMTEQEAVAVDGVLRELYGWCQQEQVPITAHCGASNAAHEDYLGFSSPASWAKVLAEFPGLHLNLGHFGGAEATLAPEGWPRAIAALAGRHPHLFADVGNHRIDQSDIAHGYLQALKTMFGEEGTSEMRPRLMYGSDWFMLAILPEHERFLAHYRSLYDETMGDPAATAEFMGGAALRFLGFDDPGNRNRRRLRARYERYAPDRVPSWLA